MPDTIPSYPLPAGVALAPTQNVDAMGVGVPFVIMKAFAANATSVAIFNANTPYKIRVLDVRVHVTTKSAQTLTLQNGANSITDAISLNPTNVNSTVAAGTINPTYYEVAKGGSLTGALSAAGAAGTLMIHAIKVA